MNHIQRHCDPEINFVDVYLDNLRHYRLAPDARRIELYEFVKTSITRGTQKIEPKINCSQYVGHL